MELEYFVKPEEGKSKEMFEYWQEERIKWYMEHNKNCSRRLGFPKKLEGEIKKEGVKFS